MAKLPLIFGDEMSEQICRCYNELARQRNLSIFIDFNTLKQCSILELSKKIKKPKEAEKLKKLLTQETKILFNVGIKLHKETIADLSNLIKNN